MPDKNIPNHLFKALAEREQKGMLRKLSIHFPTIDLCSNDYLGFSKLGLLTKKLEISNLKSEFSDSPIPSSPSPTPPLSPSPPEHVASDVAKYGEYQTPAPRYQETSDGFRRQIPWMREVEDPNPRKLPGMWLKHPTCYGKGDNPGAKWEPCG